MRGRCEGSPVGKFLARHKEQVLTFGFSRGFPVMNRFRYLDFSAVSRNFYGAGPPKKSQNLDFYAVSWDFEGRACSIFFETRTSPQFSQDLEETDPPKKKSEPVNLSAVFLGI